MSDFRRTDELTPALRADMARLYAALPAAEQTVFSDPAFLEICWDTLRETGECLALVYSVKGETAGLAFFRRETIRLTERMLPCCVPLGHLLTDFTTFLVQPADRPVFFEGLVDTMLAAGEYFLLPNVRDCDAAHVPPDRLRWFCSGTVGNPVCVDDGDQFRAILKKNSLRRAVKGVARLGDVRIEHVERGVPAETVACMARMHAERWRMDGFRSDFATPRLSRVYGRLADEFAGRSAPGNGILVSTVRVGGTALSMHICYRWGQTLLLHIGASDTACLEWSPGQVMLHTLFQYAADHGLQRVDFGIGTEDYKWRFTTENIQYRSYMVCPSIPAALLTRALKAALEQAAGRAAAVAAGRLVRGARGVVQRGGLTRALRQLPRLAKASTRTRRVIVLETCGESYDSVPAIRELDFQAFVAYTRDTDAPVFPLSRLVYRRFRGGSRLFVLDHAGRPVSFAWVHLAARFFSSELGRDLVAAEEAVWIYDIVTDPVARGQGHMTSLLRSIVAGCAGERVLVYVDAGNRASRRAIGKAGFRMIGHVRTLLGVPFSVKGQGIRLGKPDAGST